MRMWRESSRGFWGDCPLRELLVEFPSVARARPIPCFKQPRLKKEISMPTKYVYFFGAGKADGKGTMKDLLGGKGAGLAEMTNAGVPVPPGFTITTDVFRYYYANKQKLPKELAAQQKAALDKLQKTIKKSFGDPSNP